MSITSYHAPFYYFIGPCLAYLKQIPEAVHSDSFSWVQKVEALDVDGFPDGICGNGIPPACADSSNLWVGSGRSTYIAAP